MTNFGCRHTERMTSKMMANLNAELGQSSKAERREVVTKRQWKTVLGTLVDMKVQ